jgi:DNA-binding IclR family transcriptional regulator
VLQGLAESTERSGARLTDLAAATKLDPATTRRMFESLNAAAAAVRAVTASATS